MHTQSQLAKSLLYVGVPMILLSGLLPVNASALGNSTNSTISENLTSHDILNSTQSVIVQHLNNTVSANYTIPKQIVNTTNIPVSMTNTTSILTNKTVVIVTNNTSVLTNKTAEILVNNTQILINKTASMLTNNTITNNPVSNSTMINGTITKIIQNATSIVPTNQPMPSIIKSVPVVVQMPNATASFSSASNHGIVGDAKIENQTFHLAGQGYVSQSVQQVNTIKALTISAWVMPDYTQGSAVFTVISKERQFALTINNSVEPKMTAQFSVFDGISWTTVNSGIQIPSDSWTHLSATYNRTNIAIYVNGTLQSSLVVNGVLEITDNGHLEPVTPDHISSNSDVVIGAAIDSVRDYAKDKFSGQIENVHLYDKLFDLASIYDIFKNELESGSLSTSSLNSLP